MLVSVVIPLHNKAPYFKECLNSVLAQTHRDLEVVVVDDAGTDGGAALATDCGDARVRLVTLERNVGPGMAAQRGMEEAQGRYIVRMDADDVMHPARVERQVAFLEEHPEVDLCGTALDLIGRSDIVRRCPLTHADIVAQLLFGVGIFQPTMAVRRAALERSGLRYLPEWPWYGEDRLYQMVAVQRGLRLAALPEVLLHYREGPQNAVHRVDRMRTSSDLDSTLLMALLDRTPEAGELALHAWASKRFDGPITAPQVTAYRAWLDTLVDRGREAALLEVAAVKRRCDRAWDELWHHLPFHDHATVKAYLAAGGRLTPARIYYGMRRWLSGPEKEGA